MRQGNHAYRTVDLRFCVKMALKVHSKAVLILSLPELFVVVTSISPTSYCSRMADTRLGSTRRSRSDLQAKTMVGNFRLAMDSNRSKRHRVTGVSSATYEAPPPHW